MRIDGAWIPDSGGVLWPAVRAELLDGAGHWVRCTFHIDSGAELTLLSADVCQRLGLPLQPTTNELHGVGGSIETARIETTIRFVQFDGSPATVRHTFEAALDPAAVECSLLGMDVLRAFAVILDRRSQFVSFLSGRHRYLIQES